MYKNEKFIDGRIVKTRSGLKRSLLDLLKEKKFNDIRITDIVARAGVHRGSFYNHYDSKEDLLNQMIDEVLSDMVWAYRKPYLNTKPFVVSNLSPSSVEIFNNVKQHADFYTVMIKSDILFSFQNQLYGKIKKLNEEDLFIYSPKISRDLFSSYLAYAIVGLLFKWIASDFQQDSEYMAEQLLELMQVAPKQVFKTRIKP